jgi:hypothetical protein
MTNNTTTARIARYIAVPLFLGGAALGMAGMASAATYSQPADPGFTAPSVKAHPAPGATPGWHNHHGEYHIRNLVNNGYHR